MFMTVAFHLSLLISSCAQADHSFSLGLKARSYFSKILQLCKCSFFYAWECWGQEEGFVCVCVCVSFILRQTHSPGYIVQADLDLVIFLPHLLCAGIIVINYNARWEVFFFV
jgi:hypothetical protein